MTTAKKDQAVLLDKALDKYIGRIIYQVKNDAFYFANDADGVLDKTNFTYGKLPLENLYDYAYLNIPKDFASDKIFTMLTDFKISFIELCAEYYSFSLANNRFIKAKLNDNEKLVAQIEMHNLCINFIFKYRSLWDKIMGLIVFIYLGEKEYESFLSVRSRKNKFKKLLEKEIIWSKIQKYYGKLEQFDNVYRTPEAHLNGKARKEILFIDGKPMETDYNKRLLDEYFNPLMDFCNILSQLLNYGKTKNTWFLENIVV